MPPTFTDEGLRAALEARRRCRRSPCWCSRSTSSGLRGRAAGRRRAAASATCSRSASATSREFVDAVRRVAAGGTALDPEVVAAARRAPPAPRAARAAHAARARGARADGRGPLERRDRRRRWSSRTGRSRSTSRASSASSASPTAGSDNRRVLAVLAYLRAAEDARGNGTPLGRPLRPRFLLTTGRRIDSRRGYVGPLEVARTVGRGGGRGVAVRVVIADDSILVREGIVAHAAPLRDRGGRAGVRRRGAAARRSTSTCPTSAIIDIRMPPTHTDEGLRAAHEIRARHPGIGIVILSQHVEVGTAARLLAESPERLGYLLKDRVGDIDDFSGTLRRVVAGGSALDPRDRLAAARGRAPRTGRWRRSAAASARCSSSSPRGARTRASASGSGSASAPCRST